jgi:hypothetical protein
MSYPEPRRHSSANGWLILLCMILGLMLAKDYWIEKRASHQERPVAPRADLAMNEQATIARFEEASPSVVYITSVRLERRHSWLGGLNVYKIPSGTGTGFIWNDQVTS